MTRRRLLVAIGVLWIGTLARPAATAEPSIEELRAEVGSDGRLQISFRIEDLFSHAMIERLRSGLPVSFRHRIEVTARRAVPLWFPKVLARANVVNTVQYDSLTRQYELYRRSEVGRRRLTAASEVHRVSESVAEMREFMSRIDELPPLDLSGARAGASIRVQVKSEVGQRFVLYFIPASVEIEADLRLELP